MTLTVPLSLNSPEATSVEEVLRRMVAGSEDPLVLVRDLMAAIRPRSRIDEGAATRRWQALLDLLEEPADYRRAASATLLALFADREQRPLYTEAGLLPNTGFFSELRRKLAHKLLPELVDPGNLRDCVRIIFPESRDTAWLWAIPAADRVAFWQLLGREPDTDATAHRRMRDQLLDSAVILGHRIAAMGLEPELLRILPRLAGGVSPFIALSDEVSRLAGLYGRVDAAPEVAENDERHLLVLLEQCRDAVRRAHQVAATRGTSLALTFLVVRLQQHLERLDLLVRLLATPLDSAATAELAERWSAFLGDVIRGEQQRNSLRKHLADLLVLLSLRVTENAGRTGEHYIAHDRSEWRGIGRAAAGAGLLIAFMALLKIQGSSLILAPLNKGLMNGAIYGVGFVIIHLCHGIVATKQPAMTAATLAAAVSQTRGRLWEIERLAGLIVATVRGQIAAIAGNVLVAFPLAVAVALAFKLQTGGSLVAPTKATLLLREVEPLAGPALLYAAVAGFWLFTAGLVSGYVDNQAAYGQLGERVARLPWLLWLLGPERAGRLGGYLDGNAGGLTGNLFFGMMLGLTPAVGAITGLPLDIRHIAFSAANYGYSLVSLDFRLETLTLLRCGLGVLLIGAVNLAVSFSLALWVALRSRNVDISSAASLLPELGRRLRTRPLAFFVPAREGR